MHPDFWHARWQQGQIGFHQSAIHPWLIEFWPRLPLQGNGTIFVPLCGKSRDMLWLREQGHDVVGVELSPLAVEAFFDEQGWSPRVSDLPGFKVYEAQGFRLLCGDFFALSQDLLGNVSGCYDRAALVALPEEMRAAYVRHLTSLLSSDAETLLIAFEYPQHEMSGPPFCVDEEEVLRLFGPAGRVERVASRDILADEPRFREKGLTRLHEHAFRFRRQNPI